MSLSNVNYNLLMKIRSVIEKAIKVEIRNQSVYTTYNYV